MSHKLRNFRIIMTLLIIGQLGYAIWLSPPVTRDYAILIFIELLLTLISYYVEDYIK